MNLGACHSPKNTGLLHFPAARGGISEGHSLLVVNFRGQPHLAHRERGGAWPASEEVVQLFCPVSGETLSLLLNFQISLPVPSWDHWLMAPLLLQGLHKTPKGSLGGRFFFV